MATAGTGSGPHVVGELFKMMAGVDLLHVPYRGAGAALTDLIAGQVQVMFSSSSIGHIRDEKLRALAVTTALRSELLPNIPAMGEFVPGYPASGFFGLGAPKHTAAEIINSLNREINAALVNPRIKDRLADQGGIVVPGSPADFGKLIADETEKWAKVINFAGLKAECMPHVPSRPVRRTAAKIGVPCQPRRAMAGFMGRPADICSMRVLRI
jgi:tripartite-type tricarboxylate transporter receptor subunit TctC